MSTTVARWSAQSDEGSSVSTRVSVSTNVGNQANGPSAHASISADGRFVSFASLATNLGPGDTNGFWDVYVHDRVTRTTTLVSRSQAGAPGNGDSTVSAISANGRHVVPIGKALRQRAPDDSVLDLKAEGRGDTYVKETIKMLPEKPEPLL